MPETEIAKTEIAKGTCCYFVMQTKVNDQGEYIPCIAIEGEKGYHPTDWAWGKDLEIAEKIAREKNKAMGIDDLTAFTIVAHTMSEEPRRLQKRVGDYTVSFELEWSHTVEAESMNDAILKAKLLVEDDMAGTGICFTDKCWVNDCANGDEELFEDW